MDPEFRRTISEVMRSLTRDSVLLGGYSFKDWKPLPLNLAENELHNLTTYERATKIRIVDSGTFTAMSTLDIHLCQLVGVIARPDSVYTAETKWSELPTELRSQLITVGELVSLMCETEKASVNLNYLVSGSLLNRFLTGCCLNFQRVAAANERRARLSAERSRPKGYRSEY